MPSPLQDCVYNETSDPATGGPMDTRQRIAISEFVSERTPRPLMGPILTFDLAEEMAALRAESVWQANGHNARTLIKHSEYRVVLIALREGSHVHEQQTDE